MFLTDEQIIDLTHRKQHSAQRRTLMAMGIPFGVRPDGSLAILRSAVDDLLNPAAKRRVKTPQPDWSKVS